MEGTAYTYNGEETSCGGWGKRMIQRVTRVKNEDGTEDIIDDVRGGVCFDCIENFDHVQKMRIGHNNGLLLDITNYVEINNVVIGWKLDNNK